MTRDIKSAVVHALRHVILSQLLYFFEFWKLKSSLLLLWLLSLLSHSSRHSRCYVSREKSAENLIVYLR